MNNMDDTNTKVALKLCRTFEEFDSLMNQTWCTTDEDKIEYLKTMFDVDVIHGTSEDKHTDYLSLANTIMNFA